MYSVLYTPGTAVHVQATMQGIGVAQKRTRSGNAHAAWSMQLMHSEGQRNGTRRHNSVHACTVLPWSVQHAYWLYMWERAKTLDRQWRKR